MRWRCHVSAAWLALILIGSLTVSGCTYQIVSSQKVEEAGNSGTAEPGGLVYALPMTLVTVTGAKDDADKVTYTVTPSIVPDSRARYRLRYAPPGNTDNDLNLQVDKNGLLTSTRANFTDRTGDIVIAVAKTVAAVARSAGGGAAVTDRASKAPVYPFTAIYTIDELIGGQLLPDNAWIYVNANWPVAGNWQPAAEAQSCSYSICFRTVAPMKGTILGGGTVKNEFVFVAVDPRRTEGITLNSAALVARTNLVTFDSGLITSVTINEPSTTLAIASLPLAVIKAILAVPSELLTLRIANVTNEANLAKAQADLLTQMKAVLDAQTALQNAQAGTKPNPPSPVTGTGTSPQ
jgi:hypothetical protein